MLARFSCSVHLLYAVCDITNPVAGTTTAGRIGTLTELEIALPFEETPETVRLNDAAVSLEDTATLTEVPSALGVSDVSGSSELHTGMFPG